MAHDFKRFPELTNSQMQFYYFQSPHRQITENFTATVVKVTDGDTIRVEWEGRDFDFPVRFLDIAAAELDEKGGTQSQKWLENRILGKDIEVRINPTFRVEKWGRLLGAIYQDGLDVGKESVMLGFSVPWARRDEGKV
tara:strand:+ start:2019 stop:2432 length:414 start_codon:yes stop_codon:yes gene_type:complete